MLVNNFNGEVPDTMEELVTLPGVARKLPTLCCLRHSKNLKGSPLIRMLKDFLLDLDLLIK